MPIPFDDLSNDNPPVAVAWLRLVADADGRGIRGALFQTDREGRPLAFGFTAIPRTETGRPQPEKGKAAAGATVIKALFQATLYSPAVILALAEEMPAARDLENLRVKTPFCLVKSGPEDNIRSALDWVSPLSAADSPGRRFMDEIMAGDNPLEPLERAGRGLTAAFADRQVQALETLSGLAVTINLSPLTGNADPRRDATEASRGADSESRPTDSLETNQTLAQRLWAVLSAPGQAGQAGQARHSDPCRERDEPRLEWAGQLMPFQQDGVHTLLESQRLLLADDMGLGKTLQAIAAVRILRAQGRSKSCLVVAPAGVLDQWRREIAKWAPELSAIIIRGSAADRSWQWQARRDITLVSYETLRADAGGSPRPPVYGKTWDVVVADEAQRIKNRNDTSAALKGLPRTRSWALTGTPIENHEEELASILEFVDHNGGGAPRRYYPGAALLTRHRELQLRRRKGDVLDDLPPKQVTKLPIPLKPRQQKSYDTAEEEGIVYLKSLGSEVRVTHILELITRLKQICNADPKTGESSKLEDIRERIEQLTAQCHKALVFSQYTNEVSGVAMAANYLRGFRPLSITGDMPQEDRTAVIDRFKARPEHQALLLSLRAGGLGLNLQEASYVFHLDRWWNPALERQAEDRSHRMGQTVKVNVIKYSCTGTIEERIDAILEGKQELFDQLIDDVSLDLSARLNRAELLGLFGLENTS